MASEDMSQTGYSREEEYFYKRNQELIERRRRELDAERAGHKELEQGAHWMRCPKCGGQMEEVDLAHIKVDKCTDCRGIFFDHGELETLLESQEPTGFLSGLKRLFG